jgi:hypothetical protein
MFVRNKIVDECSEFKERVSLYRKIKYCGEIKISIEFISYIRFNRIAYGKYQ